MTNKSTIKVNPETVTFGIEIECAIPTTKLHEAGIILSYRGYELPNPFPIAWIGKTDSSLGGFSNEYTTVEFVSPVLKGIEGIQEVERVLEIINEMGGKVNRTCGMHIHIGIDSVLQEEQNNFEFVAEWVRRLINNTSTLEDSLIGMTGSLHAINNTYARSIKRPWKDTIKKGDSIHKIEQDNFCVGRYVSLNLNNIWDTKRTVEFRIFRGTLNANKVISYIITAIGIAQKSAEQERGSKFETETGDVYSGHYYQDARTKMIQTLRWRPSKRHFGFSDEMWTLYSKRVLHNTMWNCKHLDKKMTQ